MANAAGAEPVTIRRPGTPNASALRPMRAARSGSPSIAMARQARCARIHSIAMLPLPHRCPRAAHRAQVPGRRW